LVDDKELVDRIRRFQSQSILFILSDDDAIKRQISAPIKERVKQGAGEKCPLCPITMISSSIKRTPLDERESTPDHIVDLVIGGNNTEENVLILCHMCNWAKNHAMQRHLTISGMAGGTPGHKSWRPAFRRKGSNIAKLLEYVEWSFRIEEPSSEHRFPELHGYFMQSRFGKSEEPKSKIEKTSDNISQTPTISELDKRLEKLENTMWKRFTRFISRPFRRKQKKTPKKTTEEPKTRKKSSHWNESKNHLTDTPSFLAVDFSPEDFAAGLLSQKKREQPVTFTTLYERLAKENPKFKLQQYGIRPNNYLTEKCPDFLTIIEKPDGSTPPKIHLWITEKTPPEMEIDGLSREKVTLDIRLDPTEVIKKAKEAASKRSKKKINDHRARIARTNVDTKETAAEEESMKGATAANIGKTIVMLEDKSGMSSGTTANIVGSNGTQWKLSNGKTIQRSQHMEAWALVATAETNATVEGILKFKHIIKEILVLEPEQRATVSAIGQRFSKEVQASNYDNKKDFFKQNGIDPKITIRKAIAEFFDDEEVTIEDIRDVKWAVLNRRD